jgi:hypothetical protein
VVDPGVVGRPGTEQIYGQPDSIAGWDRLRRQRDGRGRGELENPAERPLRRRIRKDRRSPHSTAAGAIIAARPSVRPHSSIGYSPQDQSDGGHVDTSRREANTSDTASHLSIGAIASRGGRRTEATASEHGLLPEMLPGDFAKVTIDAAWDRLPEDVKAKILEIVQEAVRKHGGE